MKKKNKNYDKTIVLSLKQLEDIYNWVQKCYDGGWDEISPVYDDETDCIVINTSDGKIFVSFTINVSGCYFFRNEF